MKKTLFALFAVLLVLLPVILLATCDLLEPPPDTEEPPPDGMVRLAVNVVDGSAGRALTTDNAPSEADYYEVIFLTDGRYYQMAWDKTNNPTTSPSITIPTADYNGSGGNDAVLFAGKEADKILLGVGTLSTTNIQESTKSVSFTVGALKSVVDDTGSSAFKIISPSNDGNSHSYVTGADGAAGTLKVDYTPIFPIPQAGYVAGSNPSSTSEAITGEWTVTIPNPGYVKLATGGWSVVPVTSITPNTTTAFGGTTPTYTPTTPDNSSAVGSAISATTTAVFTFDIVVPATGTPGVTGFYINVPVRAFDNTITNYEATILNGTTVSTATTLPITWNIRGGTDITVADTTVTNNTGAVIILGVGTHVF